MNVLAIDAVYGCPAMETVDRNAASSCDYAEVLTNPISSQASPLRVSRVHLMPQGAEVQGAAGTRFRLWAPAAPSVRLEIQTALDLLPMENVGNGWHELTTRQAGAGTRYQFVLPDGRRVPDPASRYQPADVQGPSEVIDPKAYVWTDGAWQGRSWQEAVVYETHIGSFTPEGTFRAAIDRFDHLASLGVNAIEIMPVADFAGGRNWGYDGVLLYAPDSTYGRPEDLKALVEAAHARGISVLLDVVYNHFGPHGNFLPLYAPEIYTDRHKTPWGDAINYDGQTARAVREFIIHNALYWLEEYHLDGLRLDAVHAIVDDSSRHLLDELAERARAAAADCPVHLVLENEENSAERLRRRADRLAVQYSAQWNDEVHHALHMAATGESAGYYGDYVGDTEKLGRSLAEGFAFQGEAMRFSGSPRGEPSAHLPPDAFVSFIQNHDQIGNRAYGDRLSTALPRPVLRAIAAVYLLLPQVPMLFMGEEWATKRPFPFFCDFHGELGAAVTAGRRREFAHLVEFQDEAMRARIPDPQAPETFTASKLDWESLADPDHAEWLEWYKRVLETRRRHIVPLQICKGGHYQVVGPGAIIVRWRGEAGTTLTLTANLSARMVACPAMPSGRSLWREGAGASDNQLCAWSVHWAASGPSR